MFTIFKDAKKRQEENISLRCFLEKKEIDLSFSTQDINLVKDKINTIYNLENLNNQKKSLRKLNRIKSELLFIEERAQKMSEFMNTTVLSGVIIALIVGFADKPISFFENIGVNAFSSIVYALVTTMLGAMLFLLFWTFKNMSVENKKMRHRKIAILAINEMIEDKELKKN